MDRGLPAFDAELRPHRALSRKAVMALCLVLGAASLVLGLGFILNGAWPVMGFLGLDVLLVWIAWSARDRRVRQTFERITIFPRDVLVESHEPGAAPQTFRFDPCWLRVRLLGESESENRLVLSSHGRHVRIGDFLSAAERADFAAAMEQALARLKSGG